MGSKLVHATLKIDNAFNPKCLFLIKENDYFIIENSLNLFFYFLILKYIHRIDIFFRPQNVLHHGLPFGCDLNSQNYQDIHT